MFSNLLCVLHQLPLLRIVGLRYGSQAHTSSPPWWRCRAPRTTPPGLATTVVRAPCSGLRNQKGGITGRGAKPRAVVADLARHGLLEGALHPERCTAGAVWVIFDDDVLEITVYGAVAATDCARSEAG